MAKMVISMVLEGNKATLENLVEETVANCAGSIKSLSVNEIEEQKQELKIPKFMITPL